VNILHWNLLILHSK